MTDRLPCLVPHCRRTCRQEPDPVDIEGQTFNLMDEWICARHWPLVPAATRRLYSAAKRRLRKFRTKKCAAVASRLWRRCKREAIERAAGI